MESWCPPRIPCDPIICLPYSEDKVIYVLNIANAMAGDTITNKEIFCMIDPFRYGGHSKNTKRSAYDDFRRRCRIAEESLDKLWPFVEANPGVTNASYEPTYFISDYIDMACVCSESPGCNICFDSAMKPLIAVCQWKYYNYEWSEHLRDFDMKNMRKAIQLLVDHGADVSYSYYGCRPVHIVVSKLRLFQSGGPGGAILDIFLKKGADINAAIAETEQHPRWCQMYIENVEKLKERSPYGSYYGWTRQRYLQEKGWLQLNLSKLNDADPIEYTGLTPFLVGVLGDPDPTDRASSVGVLRELAARGADVHARDPCGNNALHLAIRRLKLECIPYLLSLGISRDAANNSGLTPLDMMCDPKDVALGEHALVLDLKIARKLIESPPADIGSRGDDKLADFI